MVRVDGSLVTIPQHPTWTTELIGLWVALRNDPAIVLLFPMFFASNWFYTWRKKSHRKAHDNIVTNNEPLEFNDYNAALFNIRTRSLNNLVYWISQIFGSLGIGLLLDTKKYSRRARAFVGWTVLLIMVFIVHIWAYFYQRLLCILGQLTDNTYIEYIVGTTPGNL